MPYSAIFVWMQREGCQYIDFLGLYLCLIFLWIKVIILREWVAFIEVAFYKG
jgi:hypothetical protein